MNQARPGDSPSARAHRGTNCMYTTIVYENRYRGGTMKVAPPFTHTDGVPLLENYFKAKFQPASKNLIDIRLGGMKSGSQGVVYVAWKVPPGSQGPTSAHVFNVVNQDGHTVYVDGQTGRLFTGWDQVDPHYTKLLLIP